MEEALVWFKILVGSLVFGRLVYGTVNKFGKPMIAALTHGDLFAPGLLSSGFTRSQKDEIWRRCTGALAIALKREGNHIVVTLTAPDGVPRPTLDPEFEHALREAMRLDPPTTLPSCTTDVVLNEAGVVYTLHHASALEAPHRKRWFKHFEKVVIPLSTLTTDAWNDHQRWLFSCGFRALVAIHPLALEHIAAQTAAKFRNPDNTEAAKASLTQFFPGLAQEDLAGFIDKTHRGSPSLFVFRRCLEELAFSPTCFVDLRPHLQFTPVFHLALAMIAAPLPNALLADTLLDLPEEYNNHLRELWLFHRDFARDPHRTCTLIDKTLVSHKQWVLLLIENSPQHLRKQLWQAAWRKPFLKDEALAALCAIKDADLVPFLKQQLFAGDHEDLLIGTLAAHPTEEGRDVLLDCLAVPHLIARVKHHLGTRKDDRFFEKLAAAIGNPDTSSEILLHFGDLRDDRLLAAMLDAVKHDTLTERVVPHLIHRREKAVLPTLIETVRLTSIPLEARITITKGLKMFGAPEATTALRELIYSKEGPLAVAAIEGLAFLEKTEDIGRLLEVRNQHKDTRVKDAVDRAVARLREAGGGAEAGLLSVADPHQSGHLDVAGHGGDLSQPEA